MSHVKSLRNLHRRSFILIPIARYRIPIDENLTLVECLAQNYADCDYVGLSMVRSAEAIWHGGLKEGGGVVSSASKALTTSPYSFRTRFEDEKGAGPEELIAAAHASCYSMALSMILGDAGITAETIHTFAHITTDWISEAPKLTHIHLATKIEARGADREKVEAAAHQAVDGCPISRLLKPSAEITLEVIVCV